MRIYQLSKTNIDEIKAELKQKKARIKAIKKLLKDRKALMASISEDLERISKTFGDKRRSEIVGALEEEEFDADSYLQHEDVFVIVTKDGWLKRIRTTNDPETTRIREGDSLLCSAEANTKENLAIITNKGMMFVVKVHDLASTSGYGEPVQKMFKFQDGEKVAQAFVLDEEESRDLFLYSKRGLGLRLAAENLGETKRSGKRLMKLRADDELQGMSFVDGKLLVCVSQKGYGARFSVEEVPVLSNAGKGVILQKMPDDDELVAAISVEAKRQIISFWPKGKS